mgnify:CR=1 FL=1
MKNTTYFLILFFYNFIYSQNYKFDKEITYKDIENNLNRTIYFSSKNDNIFLELKNNGSFLYGQINDLNFSKIHIFKLDTVKIENEYILKFEYKYSTDIDIIYKFNNHYEYKIEKNDDNYSYGYLNIYNNKRKRKIINQYNIKVLKGNISYFHVFRFFFLHPYENDKYFNTDIGGLIVESTSNFENTKSLTELISINDIIIDLSVN